MKYRPVVASAQTTNPFATRRMSPKTGELPFGCELGIAASRPNRAPITPSTIPRILAQLRAENRLIPLTTCSTPNTTITPPMTAMIPPIAPAAFSPNCYSPGMSIPLVKNDAASRVKSPRIAVRTPRTISVIAPAVTIPGRGGGPAGFHW